MTPGLEDPKKKEHQSPAAGSACPAGQPELSPPADEQLKWMRVARRLNEAAGYLELGLPERTLQIIDEIGDLGPFAPGAALLRGEALRLQERFAEAGASFEWAARFIPPPFDRPAYLASSMCYRQAGQLHRAINLLGFARGALPPYKKIVILRTAQNQRSEPSEGGQKSPAN